MRTCFNPRPPPGGGATRSMGVDRAEASGFNPRPPHAAGATLPGRPSSRGCARFNPRPPHAAGATRRRRHRRRRRLVSILARRTRRAQPRSRSSLTILREVSILARRTRRAQLSRSNFLIRLSESEIFREPPATAPERADLTRRAVRNDQPAQCVRTRANLRANYLHCNSAHHTTSGPSKSIDRKFPNCLIWRSAGSVRR